jgi:hypothetical protein
MVGGVTDCTMALKPVGDDLNGRGCPPPHETACGSGVRLPAFGWAGAMGVGERVSCSLGIGTGVVPVDGGRLGFGRSVPVGPFAGRRRRRVGRAANGWCR